MSQKVPEAIFSAIAEHGKLKFSSDDIGKYCKEHEGESLFIHIEPLAQVPEKLRMYAFWHVNILQCAVIGYTYAGYSGVDTVMADYLLRSEFAKDFIKNPDGTYTPIMLDKKNMTKARLLKLMQDAIFFIEDTLQTQVPSAEEWKVRKLTGKNFKEIK